MIFYTNCDSIFLFYSLFARYSFQIWLTIFSAEYSKMEQVRYFKVKKWIEDNQEQYQ